MVGEDVGGQGVGCQLNELPRAHRFAWEPSKYNAMIAQINRCISHSTMSENSNQLCAHGHIYVMKVMEIDFIH